MKNKLLIGLAAVVAAVVAVLFLMRSASAAGTGSGAHGSNGSPLEVGPVSPGGGAFGLPLQVRRFQIDAKNLADQGFINAITARTSGYNSQPSSSPFGIFG